MWSLGDPAWVRLHRLQSNLSLLQEWENRRAHTVGVCFSLEAIHVSFAQNKLRISNCVGLGKHREQVKTLGEFSLFLAHPSSPENPEWVLWLEALASELFQCPQGKQCQWTIFPHDHPINGTSHACNLKACLRWYIRIDFIPLAVKDASIRMSGCAYTVTIV